VSEQRVARLDELADGQATLVEIDGLKLALARVGDAVYACGDTCSHQGGPLSGGKLYGTRLACPWHGWSFDVKSGACLFPGRGGPVPSYSVRIDGADVFVEVP
jgi:nitrite reductase (NADH) small subunit/3-phenylpropionate/trans-cinnamate dioxygenase ferredoxin subunit